jgi:hypothetical protein
MKEFKGTREKLKLNNELMKNEYDVEYLTIDFENSQDCIDLYIDKRGVRKNEIARTKADANLIVDAFKVRQSINCELSELLEQRNEMLAMLEKVLEKDFDYDYYKEVQQLIKKVKDNG